MVLDMVKTLLAELSISRDPPMLIAFSVKESSIINHQGCYLEAGGYWVQTRVNWVFFCIVAMTLLGRDILNGVFSGIIKKYL